MEPFFTISASFLFIIIFISQWVQKEHWQAALQGANLTYRDYNFEGREVDILQLINDPASDKPCHVCIYYQPDMSPTADGSDEFSKCTAPTGGTKYVQIARAGKTFAFHDGKIKCGEEGVLFVSQLIKSNYGKYPRPEYSWA